MNIAFGPVPSRRLGRSLGINNIPPKICTYACVYCQLGPTLTMVIDHQAERRGTCNRKFRKWAAEPTIKAVQDDH